MNHVDTLPGTRSDTSPPKTSQHRREPLDWLRSAPLQARSCSRLLGSSSAFLARATPSMAPGSRRTRQSANPSAGSAWASLPRT